MKVFISQPMRGLSDEEIKLARAAAKSKIEWIFGEDSEIIDSVTVFFENEPTETRSLWYLGKSLQLLSTADVAVFIGDWKKARGCKIEHECAEEYGVDIYEMTINF